MSIPLYRRLLAHTPTISIAIGVVGSLFFMLSILEEAGALGTQRDVLFRTILAAALVAAAGYLIGAAFIWMFLGPIAARIQGWPFAIEDRVYILSGPHKGTITRIYEIWLERGQVRVDLGADAKEKVKDVLSAVTVFKIPDTSSAPP
ncbi:MAG TPA: hypothetical protein VNB29_05920 [Chthoniobacterales bacterium]|nr:hypothetical protein [Chthoniobacterales bacterium]